MSSVSTILPYLLPLMASVVPGFWSSRTCDDGKEIGYFEHVESGSQSSDRGTLADGPTSSGFQNPALQPRLGPLQPAAWLESAIYKLDSYKKFQDGWKGDDSLAPTVAHIDDALELADQLATEMPNIARPMISADECGAICFYWQDGEMIAVITVHGDGTYSFFAEGYDDPARSDAEAIGQPLPPRLIAAMTGAWIVGLVAA